MSHDPSRGRTARTVKRGMDVLGAATLLVLLSPVLALVAAALAVLDGPPVLFRQLRPGLGGKPFCILKFRTMRPLRPGEAPYWSDADRVTRLGRFLRATSLDELPELWNVLEGEMSLVGPRPLLVEYLDTYSREEGRRHDVPPGITGWAAVNGRHALKFHDRLKLDLWYVDHWSLWLDVRILARTAREVLWRHGVATTQDIDEIDAPLPRPASALRGVGQDPGGARR
ncbi:sugar transferase [Anaeromyxobacter oryzisoli]|uniref:sugar transferase n=1 Tax=Anaeromyxobacter oryzisoli TaxID=2925408 RepID=UPI001F5786EB|nr:sugar transferase [Anaeromyxobacter sp. SG63]